MFAEIITIGDELLIGQVVDTNSAWMGRELNKNGIEVIRTVTVRDRENEIREALDAALADVDIVLVTGGLGPTKDDITKQTLCRYFHTKMVFSQAVLDNIKRLIGDRVPINELNRSQAMVPQDCIVINNRVGTASISWFEREGSVVVSMPGVPEEMMTAMSEEVIPRLRKRFHTDVIVHQTYVVKDYAESVLAEKIADWEQALPASLKLAYLPKMGIIRLRLTGRGDDKAVIEKMIADEGAKLHRILGNSIVVDDDIPAEVVVGEQLLAKKLTVATAESCTGGGIAARMTSISGSSEYVKGGIVAYTIPVKEALLGVSAEIIHKHGVVSEETVIEMVKGAMRTLKADCAMATTGVAGPSGGTPEIPVGSIWIAAAVGDRIITKLQSGDKGRTLNVERAINNAILLLHDLLK